MKTTLCAPAPDEGSGVGSGAPTAEAMMQEAIKQAQANPAVNPNPRYGQGYRYGQAGLHYAIGDVGDVPAPLGDKVKLELTSRSDTNLSLFTQDHITKMAGNPNFVTPFPTAPDFLAIFTAYQDALAACEAAKLAQKAATSLKDEMRANLSLALNQRADYVQGASNGNGPVILTSGFDVRKTRTPVGELPVPTALHITLNGTPGVMILDWAGVAHARSYVIQISPANTMAREWAPFRTSASVRLKIEGMTLGQMYAFRIAAVGGSTGQSDWSAEVVRMAA